MWYFDQKLHETKLLSVIFSKFGIMANYWNDSNHFYKKPNQKPTHHRKYLKKQKGLF